MEACQWLLDRIGEAGLKASMDGGDIFFGLPANPGRGVLIGSHTDTQPQNWCPESDRSQKSQSGALLVFFVLDPERRTLNLRTVYKYLSS